MHTRTCRLQTLVPIFAMPLGSSQPPFYSKLGPFSKTGARRHRCSYCPSVAFYRASSSRRAYLFFSLFMIVAIFLAPSKIGVSEGRAAVGARPLCGPSSIRKTSPAGSYLLDRSGLRGRKERNHSASFLLPIFSKDPIWLEQEVKPLNFSFNSFLPEREPRHSSRPHVWRHDGFGVAGWRQRERRKNVCGSTGPLASVLVWRPVVRFLQESLQTWFRAMASTPSQLVASFDRAPQSPLQEMIKSLSSRTAAEVVTECAGSAAAFWCTCASSVLLQKSLGISCASKSCKIFGITTVFVASNVAAAAAATIRCAFQLCGVTPPRDQLNFASVGRAAVAKLGFTADALASGKNEVSAAVLPSPSLRNGSERFKEWSDYMLKVGLKEGLLGSTIFWLLGGRFFRLSPSCLLAPGAFHQSHLSLRAGIDYASVEERRFIKKLGETFGCHTCGKRRNVEEWIADHQPPKRVVVMFSQTWLGHFYGMFSRAMGGTRYLPQRFYPQCRDCSSKQASVVRKPKLSRRDLVVNYWSVRPYHFTGGVVHLLRFFAGL
ncbi:conserved hypothetical protein [Neospora caninum Liverpool]|uniref:Transmembrane protein n=1 Tax=Neospora caninum (strain Liverpool) TaxID=572307 RepID=F0VRL0_NEOCL|nr:conserved hypothetical protein [Neospora caninum Liverpool]CBZ56358.1 conserved hypothetical protein [Neospora caninum Liverpool]CEL71118.1 TPA: hypothetical protein BN1204_067820 [Neospora caninum Liverpool]|eukprot:XP_003886383.1 conserved hypothetical protein [Neospora caninum Liverpool]